MSDMPKLYTIDDLSKAFDAGCAYTVGSNVMFKQLHPNKEEYLKNCYRKG